MKHMKQKIVGFIFLFSPFLLAKVKVYAPLKEGVCYLAIDKEGAPGLEIKEVEQAVISAAQMWEDVECSFLRFYYKGLVEKDEDKLTVVKWKAKMRPICKTKVVNWGSYVKAGVDINCDTKNHRFVVNPSQAQATEVIELQTIIAHEIGHVLGLGHTRDKSSIMQGNYSILFRSIERGETDWYTLSDQDKEAICKLYPCSGNCGPLPCTTHNECPETHCCDKGVCKIGINCPFEETPDGGISDRHIIDDKIPDKEDDPQSDKEDNPQRIIYGGCNIVYLSSIRLKLFFWLGIVLVLCLWKRSFK
jgi:hypothetical protein